MKKLSIFFVAVCITLVAFAQSPQMMSYQAVIRNPTNNLVTNTTVGMQISILQGSAVGPAVYVETHTPLTNTNGLATVEIGNGIPVSGIFATIDWPAGPYYIKVETDPAGGMSYSVTGTSQLLSVPYALYAATSGFTGVPNYVAKYTGTGTTIDTSQIYDDGYSVALGTTTPTHRFTVNHSGSTGIGVNSTSGFSVVDINAQSGDAALRFAADGVNQWNLRNRPADDYFEFFELGGGGSRMVIQDATGNVGIGETTSPSYKLDVLHGGSTGIRSRSSGSFSVVDIDGASGDAALRFQKAGVNQWNVRNRPADDFFEIFELGGGGSRFVIEDGTGNVGINFAAPTAKLHVGGSFTATGVKAFTIDHPLDPENKILRHFALESNEVLNVYSGTITTDANGKTTVSLPAYFEAINKDIRYQLTVVGTFAQAIVSKEVVSNQFEIATNQPNVKVSWEVTGVRNDGYMQYVNTLQSEELKSDDMKGKYIEPKAHQMPEYLGINYTDDSKIKGTSLEQPPIVPPTIITAIDNTGSVEK